MAVARKKKINNKADVVQVHLSFGLPDVKAFLKVYADFNGNPELMRGWQHTEQDVRYFLEHHGKAFLSYPKEWRMQLSGWAFAVAVRNKLLLPTATDENQYYLADCLFAKRGRPPKED